jgi:hypothetical protein
LRPAVSFHRHAKSLPVVVKEAASCKFFFESGHTTLGGGIGMEQQVVAVGDDLSPFRDALESAGFRVVSLDQMTLHEAHAVVVDGMDSGFLGIETTETEAPVIDADGMTPEQVVAAVKARALTH